MYKSLYTGCSFGKKPHGVEVKWGKEGEPAQVRMAEWATATDTGPVSPGNSPGKLVLGD